MTETTKDEAWMVELREHIEKARKEGKWLWCSYQDLWFSPDELIAHNAKGKFIWGVVNWSLRDPREYLGEAERQLQRAQSHLDQVKERIERNPKAG